MLARDVPVVTVDGPTGAGKGTLGYALSRALGFHLLDSGALYRLCALSARRRRVPLDDEAAVTTLARELDVRFETGGGDPPVLAFLDGENVEGALRSEQTGNDASRVASMPRVRTVLMARQRAFRRPPGLVADGRDMGTVVFPDARVKIFVTASPEVRARRRYNQLIAKGIDVSLDSLIEDVAARDRRDSARSASPLKPAADAVVIDGTDMSPDAVFKRAMDVVASKGLVVAGTR